MHGYIQVYFEQACFIQLTINIVPESDPRLTLAVVTDSNQTEADMVWINYEREGNKDYVLPHAHHDGGLSTTCP